MKLRIPFFAQILVIVIFLLPISSYAVVSTNTFNKIDKTVLTQTQPFNKIHFETLLGRKLTFKEELVFPLIKRNFKRGLSAEVAANEAVTDGMAIAGFVTGLVSLLVAGIILGTLGIVFSAISMKRIKREPEKKKGRGLAIAGLVLGIIGFIGSVIVILSVL